MEQVNDYTSSNDQNERFIVAFDKRYQTGRNRLNLFERRKSEREKEIMGRKCYEVT